MIDDVTACRMEESPESTHTVKEIEREEKRVRDSIPHGSPTGGRQGIPLRQQLQDGRTLRGSRENCEKRKRGK
jgi:hypothetical protein